MLFNSLQFLVFFPVVTLLYFLLPHRWRWLHLLLASCVFYMYFIPVYILILAFTIALDYIAGIMIGNASGRRRKVFLVMSIAANLGVLAVFKYYNFFAGNINGLLHLAGISATPVPLLDLILPIGLSFHTFQAMSYTIEVYRGNQAAEKHFGIYALYVMFYPQLVAGPIERPQNMLHQFRERKEFDYFQATGGLKLMMWGMFKKVVIADRLARLTDPVFNHPHDYPPMALLLATLFFSFQIYCDFSGYSDIALGAAKVMGFRLMKNFDRPYQSKRIAEFWKRWHISLSSWFRDYLYLPLGGSRVAVPRWYFNLFLVFFLSGFWHGANWTFVVWGALHGSYLVFAIITRAVRAKVRNWWGIARIPWLDKLGQVLITFVLVSLAWIFFRANTIGEAFYIARRMPSAFATPARLLLAGHLSFSSLLSSLGRWSAYQDDIVISFALIFFLQVAELAGSKYDIPALIGRRPIVMRWALYYLMVMIIIFFGVYENRQFIYFQF